MDFSFVHSKWKIPQMNGKKSPKIPVTLKQNQHRGWRGSPTSHSHVPVSCAFWSKARAQVQSSGSTHARRYTETHNKWEESLALHVTRPLKLISRGSPTQWHHCIRIKESLEGTTANSSTGNKKDTMWAFVVKMFCWVRANRTKINLGHWGREKTCNASIQGNRKTL